MNIGITETTRTISTNAPAWPVSPGVSTELLIRLPIMEVDGDPDSRSTVK